MYYPEASDDATCLPPTSRGPRTCSVISASVLGSLALVLQLSVKGRVASLVGYVASMRPKNYSSLAG